MRGLAVAVLHDGAGERFLNGQGGGSRQASTGSETHHQAAKNVQPCGEPRQRPYNEAGSLPPQDNASKVCSVFSRSVIDRESEHRGPNTAATNGETHEFQKRSDAASHHIFKLAANSKNWPPRVPLALAEPAKSISEAYWTLVGHEAQMKTLSH